MYQKSNIKINLPGGLVSPAGLLSILDIARTTSIENISFGARQQLLMSVKPRELDLFIQKMQDAAIVFETDMEIFPNITSSFAFADVLQHTEGWVSEGVYLDILGLFDYKPVLKINIGDSSQSHTPFFTGHLNFIASDIAHFWFCYIRFPKSNTIERFPKLIYTQDIHLFAKQLEVSLLKNDHAITPSLHPAFDTEGVIFRQIEKDLTFPRFVMPYYEGINRQPDGKLWLGIYRRNEDFPVHFLTELCQLCEETRIGNICITNWRSLIIKGIQKEDRLKWEKLLGKHGINVRHASNELNWQIEDVSPKGFRLKQYLVRQFDAMDVRTFGLVFAIKTRRKSEVFGSIIIRREPLFRLGKFEFDFFGLLATYDVSYVEDFNPRTRKRKIFGMGIPKSSLAAVLLNLTKIYYKSLTSEKTHTKMAIKIPFVAKIEKKSVFRCKNCWTVFNENREGSVFEKVRSDYVCPICEANKIDFEVVEMHPV